MRRTDCTANLIFLKFFMPISPVGITPTGKTCIVINIRPLLIAPVQPFFVGIQCDCAMSEKNVKRFSMVKSRVIMEPG